MDWQYVSSLHASGVEYESILINIRFYIIKNWIIG